MAKNILQDIVPPEKRSIRNIPLPNRGTRSSPPPPLINDEQSVQNYETPKIYPYENAPHSSFFRKKSIWIASGIAIIIVVFAVSSIFTGATVSITPKEEVVGVSQDTVLKAKEISGGDGLEYNVMTISKNLGKSVPANGEEHVEIKANGRIIIYNTYDSNSQRLIKNTRFETPEGLIYRINESVVVPGRTGQGAQMSPGSVEVTVYADEAGEKYNIGLKDFTIPGFKGDPRFKAMYARSKTEMTEGFVGNVNKVSETDLASAKTELQDSLRNELKKDALSQIPEGFIAFDDGMTFSFESLPQSDPKGSSVTVNEKGVLSTVLFNRNKISQFLLEKLGVESLSGNVQVANLDDLEFSIKNKDSFNPIEDKEFEFTLQGNVRFISQFDSEKIISDLIGKSKKDLNEVMENYPEIEKASAVIRPFWKRTFPTDRKDIQIKTVLSKTN